MTGKDVGFQIKEEISLELSSVRLPFSDLSLPGSFSPILTGHKFFSAVAIKVDRIQMIRSRAAEH